MLEALVPLLLLYAHLLELARRPTRQSPPTVTHRGQSKRARSGAERMANYRRRHDDAYRERHRKYMQAWRERLRATAAAETVPALPKGA